MKNRVAAWGPNLARAVLSNCIGLQKGQSVVVEAWTKNLPWVDAFLVEARRIGAFPLVYYESDAAFWETQESEASESLGVLTPLDRALLQVADAYVYFYGPSDRRRFLTLPKDQFKQLINYEHEWHNIASERGIRLCRVELTRATPKLARDFGVNYEKWIRELYEASIIDPESISRSGKNLAKKLETGERLEIKHDNGTDLKLNLKRRRTFVWNGRYDEELGKLGHGATLPSGAVMTTLDEGYAVGQIVSNQTVRFGTGRGTAKGVTWIFKEGRLIDYTFRTGREEFLKDVADIGDQNLKPAFFSVGLNPKIHISPLFESFEKGTVSFSIGANEELGGESKGKHHSWISLRGANVIIDGESVVRAGKLV
jgi:leucyl aminopeptidase (aminopeptidase T)